MTIKQMSEIAYPFKKLTDDLKTSLSRQGALQSREIYSRGAKEWEKYIMNNLEKFGLEKKKSTLDLGALNDKITHLFEVSTPEEFLEWVKQRKIKEKQNIKCNH